MRIWCCSHIVRIVNILSSHESFYPEGKKPSDAGTFSRIITPQAFKRLKGLLDTTQGKIVIGGETNEAAKYIAPTFVKDVTGDDSLMRECVFLNRLDLITLNRNNREIFGPILPIVPVDLDEAITFVNARYFLFLQLYKHS